MRWIVSTKAALTITIMIILVGLTDKAYSQHWSGGPDNRASCEVIVNETHGFGPFWGMWYKITVNYWFDGKRADDLRYICISMLNDPGADMDVNYSCENQYSNGIGVNSPLHGGTRVYIGIYAGITQQETCRMIFEDAGIYLR